MSSSNDCCSYPFPALDANNIVLSSSEIHQTILKYCISRTFESQTILLREGSPNRAIYYIESGYAYLYHYHDKKLFVPFLVGRGHWITDKRSFYNSTSDAISVSHENLVAAQGAVLQELSIENYHRLIAEQRYLETLIHKKRVKILEDMYSSLIFLKDANAQKKVEWLLEVYHGILNSVPQYILASFLGMKEETFSRKLRELLKLEIAERQSSSSDEAQLHEKP
ncbi:Crp/Fnr family transcriptional regulator [Arcticibacter tournemirensis]|uniref:Crp/Fnr family transcriptional regulator n=1 Tax=Arcticibacter tournemirensis TaxID=699437 RepID=A0A4Q0MFH3_9SPHI|nr:Crp/Fnr family transcriptional regulator [Arcticibacter tournemirensis]RXF72228.1 Crp/Fnr family transcriptional regulator [Arcticibacter tournemirensis]